MEQISVYIVLILLISIAKGYYYRFNLEFAGFIGILLGVMVASNSNDFFGDFLNAISVVENHKNESTFAMSFFISVFGIWIGTLLVAKMANKATVHHQLTDNILGAFAGLMKAIVIVSYLLAVSYKINYIKIHYKQDIDNSTISQIFLSFGQKMLLQGSLKTQSSIKRVIKYVIAVANHDEHYLLDTNDTNITKPKQIKIRSLDDINGQETLNALSKNIENNYKQAKKYEQEIKHKKNNKIYKQKPKKIKQQNLEQHPSYQEEILTKPINQSDKESAQYLDDQLLDKMYQDTMDDIRSLDENE